MKIELTKSQCINLAEFIELKLFDLIRNDPEMDNLDYLRDMVNAEEALRKAVDEYEGNR